MDAVPEAHRDFVPEAPRILVVVVVVVVAVQTVALAWVDSVEGKMTSNDAEKCHTFFTNAIIAAWFLYCIIAFIYYLGCRISAICSSRHRPDVLCNWHWSHSVQVGHVCHTKVMS